MTFEIIFAFSGIMVAILLAAKLRELRREKPFILRLISQGDARAHVLGREVAHRYDAAKSDARFFLTKQLPLRTRTLMNKSEMAIQDLTEKLVGSIRETRFMKKNDGLSEFFRAISEREQGEIHETFGDSQNDQSALE